MIRRWISGVIWMVVGSFACAEDLEETNKLDVIIVVGAGGSQAYSEQFDSWTEPWMSRAERLSYHATLVGNSESRSSKDREKLKELLGSASKKKSIPLWLVMIGHGTYSNDGAKFNLSGDDVSAKEIAAWLAKIERPIVVLNFSSASGPFINALSAPGRVIVTATKSGTEDNFARFGKYFTKAIFSEDADLDHDREISVLEAFVRANNDVQAFYDSEERIATEHALIDDNGDGRGTPASMYQGIRVTDKAKQNSSVDGGFAKRMVLGRHKAGPILSSKQIERRNEIEQQLEQLKVNAKNNESDEYLSQIEPLLIELAKIYQQAGRKQVDSED